MSDVIIEVRGGNIVGIYGPSQKTRVTIVDWDNFDVSDTHTSVFTEKCLPISELPKETNTIIALSKTNFVD